MQITIYSNPGCQPCRLAKLKLLQHGVPFREKQISAQPSSTVARWKDQGHLSAPIIEVTHDDFTTTTRSGFSPEFISALISAYKQQGAS